VALGEVADVAAAERPRRRQAQLQAPQPWSCAYWIATMMLARPLRAS
jgi:hypothetical protein